MKNTIFFLSVIFVLQANTFMFGQSNSSLNNSNLLPIHQIDLVSAEMMSIVSMMLEKPSLLKSKNELSFALENNLLEIKLPSFKVNLDKISSNVTNRPNWNALNFPTIAHKDLLSPASVQQFEKLYAINITEDLKWNIFEPLATNTSLQNFVGDNVKSLMQTSTTFSLVKLEGKNWAPSNVTPIKTNKVQINNWKGQLGRGVGSYY
ncbi:MAG: hypothetical protein AB8F94_30235 [Saprospiraceae bacterium]